MKKILITIIIIILVLIGAILVYKNANNTIAENTIETNSNNVSTNNLVEETNTQLNNIAEEGNQVLNNSTKENVIENKNDSDSTTSKVNIENSITPSGFMGSSLLKVVLYSNGEAYLLHYDGEGYDDKNIISKELIATNVTSISSKGSGEDFEAIVIKGNSDMVIKNKDYTWINFEKK